MKARQSILTILFLIFGQLVFGQADTTKSIDQSISKDHLIEIMPAFLGGEQAILKIISDNMSYPEQDFKDKIGGKVVTQFTVDTLGNAVDIEIIEGIREDLDNEAIRLVGLLKGWTPATQNGKKVKVALKMPLVFYPDKRSKKKSKR